MAFLPFLTGFTGLTRILNQVEDRGGIFIRGKYGGLGKKVYARRSLKRPPGASACECHKTLLL